MKSFVPVFRLMSTPLFILDLIYALQVDVNGGDTHTAAPSEDGIGMAFWRRNQDGNVIDQHYFH